MGGLWLPRVTVTNAAFSAFVTATGDTTVAERPLDPAGFPGAPAENLCRFDGGRAGAAYRCAAGPAPGPPA